MAVVVPLVASFASVAGGVAALGAATTAIGTFAAYASIAGGVLMGVGAVTGKKDLMKVGGILGLAGGIGSALSSGAGEAAVTGVAESASEDAAANLAGSAAESSAGAVGAEGSAAFMGPPSDLSGSFVGPSADLSVPLSQRAAEVATTPAGTGAAGESLADKAVMQAADVNPLDQRLAAGTARTPGVPDAVTRAANGLTQQDLQAFWEKLKGAGEWLNKNPALLTVGGEMVKGMQQADQLDYQRALIDRARANLNNPIKLGRAPS